MRPLCHAAMPHSVPCSYVVMQLLYAMRLSYAVVDTEVRGQRAAMLCDNYEPHSYATCSYVMQLLYAMRLSNAVVDTEVRGRLGGIKVSSR